MITLHSNRMETFKVSRLHVQDSTCPLCRTPLQEASGHWVVPEPSVALTPDEMPSLILGLVDNVEGNERVAASPADVETDRLVTSCTSDGYMLVSHDT